ncbi:MAG TPA: NAD(P)-dependent oxidoreductase [Candidatus Sulfotelmatobacter sp.]|nr:NAD(P)-dependent oxidoreductase [Candidatus Sulfotelmatobacter sp.]
MSDPAADVGFIGLGVMGQPMALNLVRAGIRLVVWNRSSEKCEALRRAGAKVAVSPADLFRQAHTVFVMLYDSAAIDSVLGRGTPGFARIVAGRTIVNTSSTSPGYSRGLAADVKVAGGQYVEAPVSGSRVPAENGQLVVMLAGEQSVIEKVRPLLRPLCRETVVCGPVGNALLMKLSVNLFLIVLLTGLSEAVHFAERQGLDLKLLQAVLDAGPMASDVSRVKIAKLVTRDFAPQAGMSDARNSAALIADAASQMGISCSLLDACQRLYDETIALGHGQEDMVGVLRAIEARTDSRGGDRRSR